MKNIIPAFDGMTLERANYEAGKLLRENRQALARDILFAPEIKHTGKSECLHCKALKILVESLR
jgi:hypothetical protein